MSRLDILHWEDGKYVAYPISEGHTWWDWDARVLRHYTISYEFGRFLP